MRRAVEQGSLPLGLGLVGRLERHPEVAAEGGTQVRNWSESQGSCCPLGRLLPMVPDHLRVSQIQHEPGCPRAGWQHEGFARLEEAFHESLFMVVLGRTRREQRFPRVPRALSHTLIPISSARCSFTVSVSPCLCPNALACAAVHSTLVATTSQRVPG